MDEHELFDKLLTRALEANKAISAINHSYSKQVSPQQQVVEKLLFELYRDTSDSVLELYTTLRKNKGLYAGIRVDLLASSLNCMEQCVANFRKAVDYVPKGEAGAAAGSLKSSAASFGSSAA